MKTRPTKIETIADHVPPPDTRSTRKNQPMNATGSTSSGNRKRARRMNPAVMMMRSSSSRPTRKPSNGPSPVSSRMPMRSSNAPAVAANAMSETNANSPAATRSPAISNPTATAPMTAQMSSDQPKKPPSECFAARYVSSAPIANRTTNAPAYMRNEELDQRGRTTSMCGIVAAPSDGAPRPPLPAAGLEQLLGAQVGGGDADHGFSEPGGHAREHVGVAEVRRRLDDRLRAEIGVTGLEDARADEHAVRAELHAERGVRRRCNPARRERHHGQPPVLGHPAHEVERSAQFLRL